MSSIEKKMDLYKLFTEQNCLNPKTISCTNTKLKLIPEKEPVVDTGFEFENQIKKIFQQKKFFINNQYDHNGVKIFLEEKDECLKKMDLDDSILYKNENKKSKNEKNQYKIHKNLKISDNKEKTEIENNNQKVIDSFISSNSGSSIEKILELLK